MIALEAQPQSQVRQIFAVETLFTLLQEDTTAGKVAAAFGFTYRDFIELTGRLDLLGIGEINELRERIKHPLRSLSKRLVDSFKK